MDEMPTSFTHRLVAGDVRSISTEGRVTLTWECLDGQRSTVSDGLPVAVACVTSQVLTGVAAQYKSYGIVFE